MHTTDFDVGIIGGGPGGATIASYLAAAGVRCVVYERERFPRPHVGESLVPAATRVFEEIGVLGRLDAAGFPRKYGAVWTAPERERAFGHDFRHLSVKKSAGVRFDERPQQGVARDFTYHVDRGKFDQILLQHAQVLGATVREGAQVQQVELRGPAEPVVLHHRTARGVGATRVRMVVDASGRQTLLGRQLGLRVQDEVFDQYALHAWFTGFDRGEDRPDHIWIHFLPLDNSWVWQIPIDEHVTSIGMVTRKQRFATARLGKSRFFWSCIATRPTLEDRLRLATQVRPLKAEADYSYGMREICGDRFALIGDAARFVDPIFSSGVSIALSGARFLSRDLLPALERDDLGRTSFETFRRTMRNGTRNWYEFISLYYRLNVLFMAFIDHPKYRMDMLKLIQGDVYDEQEPEILGRMRSIVADVEADEDHLWHPHLGSLESKGMRPAF